MSFLDIVDLWSREPGMSGGCVVSRRGCGCGRVAEGSEQLGGAADDELGDGSQLLGSPGFPLKPTQAVQA